jgi:hypothetical protein
MNKLALGLLFAAFASSALFAADSPDPRSAKIIDRADADSQVSDLVVSNVDERFGFDRSEDNGRIIVTTRSVEYAIPLRSVTGVMQDGTSTWEVKYQTPDGEALASGELSPEGLLTGSSDFGTFTLPLVNLRSLQFDQPGTPVTPGKRPPILGQNSQLRPASFSATVTFTDDSTLTVSQLRRNEVYANPVGDPTLLARPVYAVVSSNYTDLRLLHGQTLQNIPFEKVKSVQFFPDATVLVKTLKGAEANMKLPERSDEVLEGFTGFSSKGDFYAADKFVRSITFQQDTNSPTSQPPPDAGNH